MLEAGVPKTGFTPPARSAFKQSPNQPPSGPHIFLGIERLQALGAASRAVVRPARFLGQRFAGPLHNSKVGKGAREWIPFGPWYFDILIFYCSLLFKFPAKACSKQQSYFVISNEHRAKGRLTEAMVDFTSTRVGHRRTWNADVAMCCCATSRAIFSLENVVRECARSVLRAMVYFRKCTEILVRNVSVTTTDVPGTAVLLLL